MRWWHHLLLLAVRIYGAMSASYIHPDEHFQGPEVIYGSVFGRNTVRAWEFDPSSPVRSVFPLFITHGIPMYMLRGLAEGFGRPEIAPATVFWVLRFVMFLLSFLIGDWAIEELAGRERRRQLAVYLVATSYVTCTYQMHTFSNSMETVVLLRSLALIDQIRSNKTTTGTMAPVLLGFLLALGMFTRLTFAAFIVWPCLTLIRPLTKRPVALAGLVVSAALTVVAAVVVDTSFYRPDPELPASLADYLIRPVITPFNLLRYNTKLENLAQHGLHPLYQHFVVNLPMLLGPAMIAVLWPTKPVMPMSLSSSGLSWSAMFTSSPTVNAPSPSTSLSSMSAQPDSSFPPAIGHFLTGNLLYPTALTGCILLSMVPHQEARFLMPAVPLFLACAPEIRIRWFRWLWRWPWLTFNLVFGILMGIYHQGGVVPVQTWLSTHIDQAGRMVMAGPVTVPLTMPSLSSSGVPTVPERVSQVVWWRTYSPPAWLISSLDDVLTTTDLKGAPDHVLVTTVAAAADLSCSTSPLSNMSVAEAASAPPTALLVVAPVSSRIDVVLGEIAAPGPADGKSDRPFVIAREHVVWSHIGFDHIQGPLLDLFRNRGLGVWSIRRHPSNCARVPRPTDQPGLDSDSKTGLGMIASAPSSNPTSVRLPLDP